MRGNIETPDGKIHSILCPDDVLEIIETYCGKEIHDAVLQGGTTEHSEEDYQTLRQEFNSYEASLDGYHNTLDEVNSMIQQIVYHDIERANRLNRQVLVNKLTAVCDMITKEL